MGNSRKKQGKACGKGGRKKIAGNIIMDNLTKEQRRKSMQNIKSKDTSIEVKLRKALWKKGFRYRKNYSKLPGRNTKLQFFATENFFTGKIGKY